VEIRPVQATSWQGTQWLVEDGLKSGERVIVEGVHRIQPGAPVKPVSVDQATGGAEPAPAADQQSNGPANRPADQSSDPSADAKTEQSS
jgi:membrane fusion protein (multidrug efflux system)